MIGVVAVCVCVCVCRCVCRCLQVPEEAGTGMVIYASTQAATKTQTVVAHVLGLGDNKVVCRVRHAPMCRCTTPGCE